jgi:transposase
MITIGVDSHKRTHTVVAVDENGRKLAEKTIATTPAGHLELVRWGRRWRERTWALEDCRLQHMAIVLRFATGGNGLR